MDRVIDMVADELGMDSADVRRRNLVPAEAMPYTVGFPKPAEFFCMLATVRHTLVECYWRTALFASWMTVLVGDPLYNPFAAAPKLQPEQVLPSPAGLEVFPR